MSSLYAYKLQVFLLWCKSFVLEARGTLVLQHYVWSCWTSYKGDVGTIREELLLQELMRPRQMEEYILVLDRQLS